MNIVWESVSQTHCGKVRKVNEDSLIEYSFTSLLPTTSASSGLWAVADGMGGYEGGDVASAIVVEELKTVTPADNIETLVTETSARLSQANTKIHHYSVDKCQGRTVGSTVVCLLAVGNQLACVWAGDSRFYRYRANTLEQLSSDHSEVAQLMAMGYITQEEARAHPKANVISKTIGVMPDRGVEVRRFAAQAGDRYLLCSDGLYNELGDGSIAAALAVEDSKDSAQQLMYACLQTPAQDNVSFLILHARL